VASNGGMTRIYSFLAKEVIANVYIVDYHTLQTPNRGHKAIKQGVYS
jgi:hypothetical protein